MLGGDECGRRPQAHSQTLRERRLGRVLFIPQALNHASRAAFDAAVAVGRWDGVTGSLGHAKIKRVRVSWQGCVALSADNNECRSTDTPAALAQHGLGGDGCEHEQQAQGDGESDPCTLVSFAREDLDQARLVGIGLHQRADGLPARRTAL